MYSKHLVRLLYVKILLEETTKCYRQNPSDFTRRRSMTFENVVLYGLNKRGLTSKMEIEDFSELIKMTSVSAPAVLNQRLKLKGILYKDLLQENLKDFYDNFPSEVKLFKGYILTAIDGSDFEIPNTKKTREKYNVFHKEESVARATISNMFDVLNHFVMDTIIEKYDYSERKMAQKHLEKIKELKLKYPIIRTGDRGYPSIAGIYFSNKNNDKFVYRITGKAFKKEIDAMETNDEEITIPYEYNRIRHYKDDNPGFYEIMEKTKEDIKVRVVKITEKDGEPIILITNLEKENFSYNDIVEIYKLRWEIEINYHLLKESIKIETITSSYETIIEQDIYSQMLAFNIIQAFANDAIKEIEQSKYKNEVKINMNMAVGFVKKALILIMIEENKVNQEIMFGKLFAKIQKYTVPIKKGRSYPRKKDKKNKHPLNKRKSF